MKKKIILTVLSVFCLQLFSPVFAYHYNQPTNMYFKYENYDEKEIEKIQLDLAGLYTKVKLTIGFYWGDVKRTLGACSEKAENIELKSACGKVVSYMLPYAKKDVLPKLEYLQKESSNLSIYNVEQLMEFTYTFKQLIVSYKEYLHRYKSYYYEIVLSKYEYKEGKYIFNGVELSVYDFLYFGPHLEAFDTIILKREIESVEGYFVELDSIVNYFENNSNTYH